MINRRNASLLKKDLDRKSFKKRLERKRMESESNIIGVINRRNGFGTNLLRKGLIENPPGIGVINRRNGFGTTVDGQFPCHTFTSEQI